MGDHWTALWHAAAGRRAGYAALVAVTGTLAACGSSSKSTHNSSSAEFASHADAICSQDAASQVAITRTPAQSAQVAGHQVDALIAHRKAALSELRALTPPAQLKASYQAFLAQWPRVESVWRRSVAKLTNGAAPYNASGAATPAFAAAQDAAAKVGLVACAGKLSPADLSAITSFVRQGELRPTRSLCTEHTSARFLSISGGMRACLQSVKTRSSRVSISNVRGTAPLASAVVTRSGGNQPAGKFVFWLVRLDGRWQLDDAY